MTKLIGILVFQTILMAGCASQPKENAVEKVAAQKQSGVAEVNGLKMYYEIHGDAAGTPLVLLHGGGSSIDVTYSKVLPFFAAKRRVIALDEQAHGRTSDRNAPVSFETSADDVSALLKFLKIERADVMGFSNGASVAMQVAIRHPEQVRKLVFVSSMSKKSGAPKGFWDMFKAEPDLKMMPQPLQDAFLQINPDPAKLKNMNEKDTLRMRNFKDVPDKDVRAIRAETLIVAGDHDIVSPAHVVELSTMIKGSRIFIVPGGHGDFLGEITTAHGASEMPSVSASVINGFLGAP